MTTNSINQRIASLQAYMSRYEIDAWIILSSDPHLSEYLPDHWKLREWFSGFKGSAGTLVVTKKEAFIWTDSRYWVQASKELTDTVIVLQRMGAPETPTYTEYLIQTLNEDSTVAVLGNTIPIETFYTLYDALDEYDIRLSIEFDPFNDIWDSRPSLPTQAVYPHNPQFVSETRLEKLTRIRETMDKNHADFHLISTLDDIAWTLNLRGKDVQYNPIFLSYLLIAHEDAILFIDPSKISDEIRDALENDEITITPYDQFEETLQSLEDESTIMLDPQRTTYSTLNLLNEDIDTIYQFNPSTLMKACKSDNDLVNIRTAMEEDGVALCEFFSELEVKLNNKETISELTIADMLEKIRSERPNFVSLSFNTIAGFNENSASPHYAATQDAHSYIKGNGLLLIDSGGQYENGTTDITRVIPIGEITNEHKHDFTLVLKSMIVMSQTHFPQGIKMPLIDAIARAPLWKEHLDFGHGTGHGIGYFLNVHEGPQVLSYHANVTPQTAVQKGMITSIEPGLYREEKWGIRIENLVVSLPVETQKEHDFGNYMYFETLTLCPIDTRCIDSSLLSASEIEWINDYHSEVYNRLSPKITNANALKWLESRTQAI